jgi:hypothetical protein
MPWTHHWNRRFASTPMGTIWTMGPMLGFSYLPRILSRDSKSNSKQHVFRQGNNLNLDGLGNWMISASTSHKTSTSWLSVPMVKPMMMELMNFWNQSLITFTCTYMNSVEPQLVTAGCEQPTNSNICEGRRNLPAPRSCRANQHQPPGNTHCWCCWWKPLIYPQPYSRAVAGAPVGYSTPRHAQNPLHCWQAH